MYILRIFALSLGSAVVMGTSLMAATATKLADFGGIEEPLVVYRLATTSFSNDEHVNITDQKNGRFRMELRYRPGEWWDGDRDTKSKDRGRAEVKVLGPRQLPGQTFDYRSTWRTNATFKHGRRFCHITQVKGFGEGDNGAPLVTQSIDSNTRAAISYCSGTNRGLTDIRTYPWRPDEWKTVIIRLRISSTDGAADGLLHGSIDGDAFTGVQDTHMYRPGTGQYQPKWGLYRGHSRDMPIGDDWIEHENIQAVQTSSTPAPQPVPTAKQSKE